MKTAKISSSEPSEAQKPNESSIFLCTVPICSVSLVLEERIYVQTSTMKMTRNKSFAQATIQTANIFIGKDKHDSEGLLKAYCSRITAVLDSTVSIHLYSIDALHVPGVLGLSSPLKNTVLYLKEEDLHVNLTSACKIVMIDNKQNKEGSKQRVKYDESRCSEESEINLPLAIHLSMKLIMLKKNDRVSKFSDINFVVKPPRSTLDNIIIKANVGKLQLDHLLQTSDISISGEIKPKAPVKSIHVFDATCGVVYVQKGFSLDDWDNITLPRFRNESDPFWMPFAKIPALEVHVYVKAGFITNDDYVVDIGKFIGELDTTWIDLKNHYVKKTLVKIPSFLGHTNVFGQQVMDHAWEIIPLLIIPPVGPIVALSKDVFVNIAEKGKKRRGANRESATNVIDFFRGIKSAQEEIKEGDFDVIEVTVTYAKQNRAQLAGTAAFFAVLPFGGPVAGMAAAVVVTNLTRVVIERQARNGQQEDLDLDPCAIWDDEHF
uniref:Uncharacterized protein n=1 Tax=Ditylum brightwellii TaxID=49249 RepID=A0A7S1YX20_9STRA